VVFSSLFISISGGCMNLGEFQRTEEFPMVVPERVQPVTIPEKAPVEAPQIEEETVSVPTIETGGRSWLP
jgi:hypothetical protein